MARNADALRIKPWAKDGDRTPFPDSELADGFEQAFALWGQGEYLDREEMNQILYRLTTAFTEMGQAGILEWDESIPYNADARVIVAGEEPVVTAIGDEFGREVNMQGLEWNDSRLLAVSDVRDLAGGFTTRTSGPYSVSFEGVAQRFAPSSTSIAIIANTLFEVDFTWYVSVGSRNNLYTIDFDDGTYTRVGSVDLSTTGRVNASSVIGGKVYVCAVSGGSSRFYKDVNLATGAATLVGSVHTDINIRGATAYEGKMLCIGSKRGDDDPSIYVWDPATGVLTHLLTFPSDAAANAWRGVAYDPDTKTIYATNRRQLFSVALQEETTMYRALRDTTGEDPETTPDAWERTTHVLASTSLAGIARYSSVLGSNDPPQVGTPALLAGIKVSEAYKATTTRRGLERLATDAEITARSGSGLVTVDNFISLIANRPAGPVTPPPTPTPTPTPTGPGNLCSISGSNFIEPRDSQAYSVSSSAGTIESATVSVSGGTVVSQPASSGGSFRIRNATAENGTLTITARITLVGGAEHECTKTLTSGWDFTASDLRIETEEGTATSASISWSGRPGSLASFTYSGTFPNGVTATSSGGISVSSAAKAGTHTNTATGTDSVTGRSDTATITIVVRARGSTPDPLTCTAPNMSWAEGSDASAYSASWSGGVGDLTASVSGLPSGVSMDTSDGDMSGGSSVAVSSGSYTITVTDSASPQNRTTCTGTWEVTSTTDPLTASDVSVRGYVNEPQGGNLDSTGGSGGDTWALDSGSDTGFSVSGTRWALTAQSAGTYRASATVTDSDGNTDQASIVVVIQYTRPTLTVAGDSSGDPGDTLRGTVRINNGSGSSQSISSPTSGVTVGSVNSSGVANWSYQHPSGATRGTSSTLQFNGSDSSGSIRQVGWTLTVDWAALTLNIYGDTGGIPGESVSGTGQVSGGTGSGYTGGSSSTGVTVSAINSAGFFTWSWTIPSDATRPGSTNLNFFAQDSRGSSSRVRASRTISHLYPPLGLTGPTTIFPVRDQSTGFQWVASGGAGRDNYTFSYTITPDPEGIPSGLTHFHNIVQFRTSANIIFEPETDGNGLFSITVTDKVTGLKKTVNGTYEAVDQFIVRRIGGVSLGPGGTVNLSIVFSGGLHPYEIAGGSETYTHPETGLRTTVSWPRTSISSGRNLVLRVTRDNRAVFDEPLLVTTALEARDASNQRLQIGLPITLAVEN